MTKRVMRQFLCIPSGNIERRSIIIIMLGGFSMNMREFAQTNHLQDVGNDGTYIM